MESTAKFSETHAAGQNTLGNHFGGRASRPKRNSKHNPRTSHDAHRDSDLKTTTFNGATQWRMKDNDTESTNQKTSVLGKATGIIPYRSTVGQPTNKSSLIKNISTFIINWAAIGFRWASRLWAGSEVWIAESAAVGWSVFSGRNPVIKRPKSGTGSFQRVADDAPWRRYNSSAVVHTNC